jgi:eukaryotic-like serine/threonine-protein kinase
MGMLFVAADDGAVHALDLADGAERWAAHPPDAAGLHNPAFADGVVYVAGDAGGYNALDARDGTLLWHHDLDGDPSGTAVVVDGIAYVGAAAAGGGHLQALDARTGELLWSDRDSVFSPGVADGIAVSPGDAGVVVAHDARAGTELWRTPVAGPTRPLAIAGGMAFVGADDLHAVIALDLHTGAQTWSFPVDANIDCCTSVAHGLVLLGTGAGSIYAIGGAEDPDQPTASASASAAP